MPLSFNPGNNFMKRFTLFAMLFTFVSSFIIMAAPASADPHKERFKQRCQREKCY
jgi:hypothetical protein